MTILSKFEARLPADRRKTFRSLGSPADIQQYLDGLPYVGEDRDRCPLDVMRDGQCHCLDGGLLAALALRRIGDRGLLVDLVPAHNRNSQKLDDDHVLAVFQRRGAWGAVAKSNFPLLRYREPVYRSVRELVMSYFDVYCSMEGIKALRAYTRPLDICTYDRLDYAFTESGAAQLYKILYGRKPIPLISKYAERLLQPADQRAFDSFMLGANLDWAYRPKH